MTTEEPATIQVVSEEPTPSPTPMPIYEEEALDDNIVNILLIGTDSRSADESENSEGRSDSMILASLNKETGKIALVSFMRDARVHRVGESGRFTFYNKLNGAYRGGYGGGGAGELIKTINGNHLISKKTADTLPNPCAAYGQAAVPAQKEPSPRAFFPVKTGG